MLTIPSVAFRPPRKKQKRKAPPVTQDAVVLAVFVLDASSALWIFNSPVTVTDEPCPQLRIQTASGWQSAILGDTSSPYLIVCEYDSGDLNTGGGDPWEIVSQPVGIDFGGATLALPQSGVTAR